MQDLYLLIIIAVGLCCLALLVLLLWKSGRRKTLSHRDLKEVEDTIVHSLTPFAEMVAKQIELSNRSVADELKGQVSKVREECERLNRMQMEFQTLFLKGLSENNSVSVQAINENFKNIGELLNNDRARSVVEIRQSLDLFSKSLNTKLAELTEMVSTRLVELRTENSQKLEAIQGVVNEKIQKTLEERLDLSFKNVIEQISGVSKAIGEIKGLANDVGSLKAVLANVKTKGIMGEVILGNLIRETLTIEQYEENVATKRGSADRVEFAIKMPAQDGEGIYLPVDSKFPTEAYRRIQQAIDTADRHALEVARKELANSVRTFAKDICTKYIDEPNTTGFAIMFLPTEGLYAEVINLGLFEDIQREFKVTICGPSTFLALLNALQMGFKSLVIQRKSADIYQLLVSVKGEFGKFAELLERTQKKMNDAGDELEKLVGVRTRAIQRRLKEITD